MALLLILLRNTVGLLYIFVGNMALYGLILYGPASHLWYTGLESLIPGASMSVVCQKLLIDEAIGSLLFGFLFFAGSFKYSSH